MFVTGRTGHAEAVRVVFDSDVVEYTTLLDIFMATHDPTSLNKQGADIGRSTDLRFTIPICNKGYRKTFCPLQGA